MTRLSRIRRRVAEGRQQQPAFAGRGGTREWENNMECIQNCRCGKRNGLQCERTRAKLRMVGRMPVRVIVMVAVLVSMAIGMAILSVCSEAPVFKHRHRNPTAIAQKHSVYAKKLRAWNCEQAEHHEYAIERGLLSHRDRSSPSTDGAVRQLLAEILAKAVVWRSCRS